MSFFTGLFNQDAVHWAAGALDSGGNATWGAGAEIASKVRWQEGKGFIRNAQGDRIDFDAVVYTEGSESISNGDRMFEGELTDLTVAQRADPTQADSWLVVFVGTSTSIDADERMKKILLRAV